MENLHKKLASGRWFELTLMEQMGNIGSEVGRAIKWRGQNDQRSEDAFFRALDLFDLTVSDKRLHKRGALKEILRAREVFCDYFFGKNEYGTTHESLNKYFLEFAVAARNNFLRRR